MTATGHDQAGRQVTARLVLQADAPAEAILQVAVAGLPGADPAEPNTTELNAGELNAGEPNTGGASTAEELTLDCDGEPVTATEIAMPGLGRAHVVRLQPGRITVAYRATVRGATAQPLPGEADRIIFLRPSRYAESDRLAAVARSEFAGISPGPELLAAVSSWVGTRLTYVPGSSRPTDGAVETLLQRQGVCRDYAHLVIALLRALDVPARLAAVYAPGLEPMDFHAVAEALVDGQWRVVDATLLAPRASLLRIATGRDAADTAFLSSYGGPVQLLSTEVTAVTGGPLPADDVTALVSIG
jgi:transglutaminase-like putative cysteine protease